MIEILEELDAASNLLRDTLDRYLSACSALKGCYTKMHTPSRFPREFSHRVTNELQRISSYETKIEEAKAAINLSRNSCTDIVPTNSLPDEILGRIFHLILDAQLCASDDSLQPISPNHIHTCSLVCSRWRQLSISLGTLWSHIDISLARSGGQYLARAVVYAARADHAPLDVCISDTLKTYGSPSDDTLARISLFLASIAPRIRSLTLDIYDTHKPYSSILGACFASCIPGVLTRLVLDVGNSCHFLEATGDSQMPRRQLMEVSKQLLEDLCFPITVLQVCGLYFPWTSRAYHGLTMLHLLSRDPSQSCISEQQLAEILKSSPQLRVFRFGHKIADPLPTDVPIVPVRLECLEVLVWESTHAGQLGTFLRLIAPGLKPLQVSTHRIDHWDTISLDEMKRFFARSNVTKLCVSPVDNSEFTSESALFDSLPPLKILALRGYIINVPHSTPEHPTGELNLHPAYASSFQALHLIKCYTHIDELQRIIKKHSVQMLRTEPGSVFSTSHMSHRTIGEKEINQLLGVIHPATKSFDWKDEGLDEDWTETLI